MVRRSWPGRRGEIVGLLEVARRLVVEALRLHRLVAVGSGAFAALELRLVGLREEPRRFCERAFDQGLVDAMVDDIEEAGVAARGSDLRRRLASSRLVVGERCRKIDLRDVVRHFWFRVENHGTSSDVKRDAQWRAWPR